MFREDVVPVEPFAGTIPGHALHRCRLFESLDIEETRDRISAVMQPHELTTIGASPDMPYHMDYLPMREMGIGRIHLGHTRLDAGEVEGYHLLIFCLAGFARVRHGAQDVEIGRANGICLAPGEPLSAEFTEDCEQLVFRINPALIDASAGQRDSRMEPIFDLGNSSLGPWRRLINTILHDDRAVDMILGSEKIAADYEQLIVNLLLAGQGLLPKTVGPATIAPGSVRRAELFILSHYRQPLRLADIAKAAGVPSRTLLESFRHFRQTSPMRYLRDVRLDRMRERLFQNHESHVSTLAFEIGFTHLGRFAGDYSQRFGETPSQTRMRARHN